MILDFLRPKLDKSYVIEIVFNDGRKIEYGFYDEKTAKSVIKEILSQMKKKTVCIKKDYQSFHFLYFKTKDIRSIRTRLYFW